MDALTAFNEALLNDLLPVLATGLGLLASRYIIKILSGLSKRVGLEYDSRNDAKIQFVVDKWVRYAEEFVEEQYKKHGLPASEKGLLKAETAVHGIVDELPGVSTEMAHILVHSTLAKLGLGAATKAVEVAAERIAAANTEAALRQPQWSYTNGAVLNGTATVAESNTGDPKVVRETSAK